MSLHFLPEGRAGGGQVCGFKPARTGQDQEAALSSGLQEINSLILSLAQWHLPVIVATWEAKTGRFQV